MNVRAGRVYAAALTPFTDDLELDTQLLGEHCRSMFAGGCDGISLFGTTGEANSLTVDERRRGLEAVLAAGVPARALMPGTGCCSIVDTLALTQHALDCGVTDVLVLPPFYYTEPGDEGVFAAYAYVLDRLRADARVYLYHIPQFSGVPIGVDLIARLRAAYPGVVAGAKDSSADAATLHALCALRDFNVFVGSERLILEALQAGAAGTICALGNTSGELLAALCADASAHEAPALQRRLAAEINLVDRHGFIPGLKAYLAMQTGNANWNNVRPPLCALPLPARSVVGAAFRALTVAV